MASHKSHLRLADFDELSRVVAPKGHIAVTRKRAPSARPLNGDLKIISGGQTGADRAALDVAIKLKIPCGGWCPEDRRAEDGPISERYPLTPLTGAGYRQRTRKNVQDSDGTAIFSFGLLTGGSKATAKFCEQNEKPCLIVDAQNTTAVEAAILVAVFLLRHRIHTLNIAGPRASGQPKIYGFVRDVMLKLLSPPKKRRKKPPMLSA